MKNFDFDNTEREAAAVLGISVDTLRRWRLKGIIPEHCYIKHGYKCVRYCLPLLQDWQIAPDDLDAQARAIALLESQRPCNQPLKRGGKLLPSKNSPQSSPINDEPKFKTNNQLTPNAYIATNSGELPDGEETQYCWGATEILNSKKFSRDPPEDEYLTAADDPDEVAIELSRSYRLSSSPD